MSLIPETDTPWLKKCREFASSVIIPNRSVYDRENRFPATVHDEANIWGMLNVDFPSALGGSDLSGAQATAGAELLASACAPIAFTLGFNRGALHPILVAGSTEQKNTFIKDTILNGRYASLCLTEAQTSGSNLMDLATTAIRVGSGWRITGNKCMVGNGGI